MSFKIAFQLTWQKFLATELVDSKYRAKVGLLHTSMFPVGYTIATLVARTYRNWKTIMV